MNKALVSSVNFDILCRHSLSWSFPVLCRRWNREEGADARLVCQAEEKSIRHKHSV